MKNKVKLSLQGAVYQNDGAAWRNYRVGKVPQWYTGERIATQRCSYEKLKLV